MEQEQIMKKRLEDLRIKGEATKYYKPYNIQCGPKK